MTTRHEPLHLTDGAIAASMATADIIALLRDLASEPELVLDGPSGRLPVDPTTAMRLLERAADWLDKQTR